MEYSNYVKKGEIYIYDFGNTEGSIQSGIRPVLIIQGNDFNQHSPTTIIAPITTAIKKSYLPSHIFIGAEYGLRKPSMVLLEQIRTINQNELGEYIGVIDNDYIQNLIWRALKKLEKSRNVQSGNPLKYVCSL